MSQPDWTDAIRRVAAEYRAEKRERPAKAPSPAAEPEARTRFQRLYLDFCTQEDEASAALRRDFGFYPPRGRARSYFRDGRARPGGDREYRRRFYTALSLYMLAAGMLSVMRELDGIYLCGNCTAAHALEKTHQEVPKITLHAVSMMRQLIASWEIGPEALIIDVAGFYYGARRVDADLELLPGAVTEVLASGPDGNPWGRGPDGDTLATRIRRALQPDTSKAHLPLREDGARAATPDRGMEAADAALTLDALARRLPARQRVWLQDILGHKDDAAALATHWQVSLATARERRKTVLRRLRRLAQTDPN